MNRVWDRDRDRVRVISPSFFLSLPFSLLLSLSLSPGKQRFLQGAHTDDIIGIASHPSGQLFATGETGRQPCIIVWNSQDMRSIARLECSHRVGIPLLAFNSKGDLLASVGLDDDHTLVVHDWIKKTTG
jgi:WD40 repeat protein